MQRLVAVKRIHPYLWDDYEMVQMFLDEASLSLRLVHPNIVRVYESGSAGQELFVAMEYVAGKDVRAILERARERQELIPEQHVAHIVLQAARGLHAAHTQRDTQGTPLSVVHRDISPSNVLVSYLGDIKLCDFGFAKSAVSQTRTETGVVRGKLKYMSPEQADGRELDARSDLFSLGGLGYELLTLKEPFPADGQVERWLAVRDARKQPLCELRPHINSDLEAVIERAMAKSRTARFQTADELAVALESYFLTHFPTYQATDFANYLQSMFGADHQAELRLLRQYGVDAQSLADSSKERMESRPTAANSGNRASLNAGSLDEDDQDRSEHVQYFDRTSQSLHDIAVGRSRVNDTQPDAGLATSVQQPRRPESLPPQRLSETQSDDWELLPALAKAPARSPTVADPPPPTRAELRQRLETLLWTDSLLDGFCLDHFPEVFRLFTNGMDRVQKTNLLLVRTDLSALLAALVRGGTTPQSRFEDREVELQRQREQLILHGRSTQEIDARLRDVRKQRRDGPSLEVEQVLDKRYVLHERLNDTGLAQVFRAYDRTRENPVALKTLRGKYARDPSKVERFVHGARVLEALRHPHILRLLDAPKEDQGRLFFVVEYLPGGSLRQAVLTKQIDRTTAFHAVMDVCRAMEAAHQQGFVHRDLGPAKMLLDRHGGGHIAGFDLAARLIASPDMSEAGSFSVKRLDCSDAVYVAPELRLGGTQNADRRSDLFSIAMVLCFVFLGRELSEEEIADRATLLQQTGAPAELQLVIGQALSSRRETRQRSLAEFEKQLLAVFATYPACQSWLSLAG